MKDSTLVKISLAWALIGIFILLVLANFAKPQEIKVSDLGNNLGKSVVLHGKVSHATYKEAVSFIDLADDTGKTTVVFFGASKNNLSFGDLIAVKGKVSVYKNEIELIADEIVCLECGI